MNNEEKILSMLETLVTKVDKLEQGQVETNQRLNNLESKVDRNYDCFIDLEAKNATRHIEMSALIRQCGHENKMMI